MNDVTVNLNKPDNKALHENIGGVSGHAKKVRVLYPDISGLKIICTEEDAICYKSVGGVFGKGENVSIVGTGKDVDIEIDELNNSERDVGGLVGNMTDSTSYIKDLEVKIGKIVDEYPCTGGVVGYVNNSNVEINNLTLDAESIEGGYFVGGIIGVLDFNAKAKITNSKIYSKMLYTKKNCDSGECTGSYVGGVVGALRWGGSLELNHVKNEFKTIKADEQHAGGILGGIIQVGGVDMADVVNNGGSSESVIQAKKFVGGLIGAAGYKNEKNNEMHSVSSLEIEHVNNRVNKIKADEFAGGLIGTIHTNDIQGSAFKISDVISRAQINEPNGSGSDIGGFIGNMNVSHFLMNNIVNESSVYGKNDLGGFVNELQSSAQTLIENIISNSIVEQTEKLAAGFVRKIEPMSEDEHVVTIKHVLNQSKVKSNTNEQSGFIFNIEADRDKIIKKNRDNSIVSVKNILTKADLYINDKFNSNDNVFHYFRNNTNWDCPRTDSNSYKFDEPKKNVIRIVFSNVFYSTPGDISDANHSSLLALTWCGDANNRSGDLNCAMHRDYLYPILGCWFTDYIYQSGLNDPTELKEENIPIKPYHPYAQEMEQVDSDYNTNHNVKLKNENKVEIEHKNVVLGALMSDKTTKWIECKNVPSNDVIHSNDYPDLLCPVLTGRLTCMGTWDEDKNECIVP